MDSTIVKAVAARSSSTGYLGKRDSLSTAIQNALIVEEISKYISISDMINCRSANNFWKTEWTPVIQKRSTFLLFLTDKIDMLVKQLQVSVKNSQNLRFDERTRNKFLRLGDRKINARASVLIQWISENIHNFPCSKIMVGTWAFKSIDKNLQEKFFRAISNIVTELQLEHRHDNPPFYVNEIQNLNLVFCKLTVLKIDLYYVTNKERDLALKFYQNVIQLATNLDTLSLLNQVQTGFQYDSGDDFGFLADCVSAISNPAQLKTLHIKGTITDNLIKKLIQKKLNLTEFLVRFEHFRNISLPTFETFLSSLSKSLKQLYLKSMGFLSQNHIAIIFPRMTKLEFLEIDGFSGIRFPNLNLHQSFPKLRRLKMVGVGAGITSDFNQSLQPVQTLDEFYLRRAYGLQNDVLQICRLFPNVKRLSVPCEKFNLLALNSGMMNSLEEVTLFSENWDMLSNMNEALTGFSGMQLIEEDRGRILVGMDRGPMQFLQKIKILRLVNGFLTDRLCIAGPMRLQSLQCLDLRISDPNKKHRISEAMLAKMRERFTVLLEDSNTACRLQGLINFLMH